MTRSTSLFCLALALGASLAAQAQVLPDKAQADAKKPAAAAKAAPKAAPSATATAKELRVTSTPAVTGAIKGVAPASMRSTSPGKDGDSDCHSKNSDA